MEGIVDADIYKEEDKFIFAVYCRGGMLRFHCVSKGERLLLGRRVRRGIIE